MNFPTLSPWMWYAIAGVAVFLLVMWQKELLAWWNTPKSIAPGTTSPTVKAGTPTRREVLDYLDASHAYFDSINCDPGKKSISEAVKHAFDEHESEGHPTTTVAK